MSPAVAILEDGAAGWILDLLGLPPAASVGFVSRRARAVPIYATLRTLGRRGVADLVERC
jgi:glutamate/tyrosine decarboxylase-like PLP-dependent enzyme